MSSNVLIGIRVVATLESEITLNKLQDAESIVGHDRLNNLWYPVLVGREVVAPHVPVMAVKLVKDAATGITSVADVIVSRDAIADKLGMVVAGVDSFQAGTRSIPPGFTHYYVMHSGLASVKKFPAGTVLLRRELSLEDAVAEGSAVSTSKQENQQSSAAAAALAKEALEQRKAAAAKRDSYVAHKKGSFAVKSVKQLREDEERFAKAQAEFEAKQQDAAAAGATAPQGEALAPSGATGETVTVAPPAPTAKRGRRVKTQVAAPAATEGPTLSELAAAVRESEVDNWLHPSDAASSGLAQDDEEGAGTGIGPSRYLDGEEGDENAPAARRRRFEEAPLTLALTHRMAKAKAEKSAQARRAMDEKYRATGGLPKVNHKDKLIVGSTSWLRPVPQVLAAVVGPFGTFPGGAQGSSSVGSSRVAAFGFEGTLVKTTPFSAGPDAYELASPEVGQLLTSLRQLGFHIVIFANMPALHYGSAAMVDERLMRFEHFAKHVCPGVPLSVVLSVASAAAVQKDAKAPALPRASLMATFVQTCNHSIKADPHFSFVVGCEDGRARSSEGEMFAVQQQQPGTDKVVEEALKEAHVVMGDCASVVESSFASNCCLPFVKAEQFYAKDLPCWR